MAIEKIVFHQRFSLNSQRRTPRDERWIDIDHQSLQGTGILHQPYSHQTHYAVGGWEGIRAKPSVKKLREGRLELAVLNGDRNIARFLGTIERIGMRMPTKKYEVSEEAARFLKPHDDGESLFLPPEFDANYLKEIIVKTIQTNDENDLITPAKGGLYVRPIIYRAGNDQGNLGVFSGKHDIVFEVMLVEWGAYLPGDGLALVIYPNPLENELRRFKVAGNYSLGSVAKDYANNFRFGTRSLEFHDALIIDNRRNIEEATGANFFAFENKTTIVTPPLDQYILPGITRATGIEIARNLGFTVREENISIACLSNMKAAYLTGTATGHCPIRVIYDPTTNTVYHFDNKFGPFLELQKEFDNLIDGEDVHPKNRDLQQRARAMAVPLN